MNEYYPNLVNINEVIKETNNTNTYILEFFNKKIRKDFSWTPGQFMMLGIPGIGESAISISSVKNENLIYSTIRNVGNVTNYISNLKKGESISVRGPYGIGWPLEKAKGKNIIIVAGGMGIAPLRGLINYIIDNRKNYGYLEIIYGARTPDDIIFKYEFNNWKKIKQSTLYLTADQVLGKTSFECKTGLVTSYFPMMKTHHRNAIALICGPEIMMRYAAKCLETIGFADDQVYLSLERRMKCGIGKCGHCQIGSKFVCKDGPVFNYADIKPFIRAI